MESLILRTRSFPEIFVPNELAVCSIAGTGLCFPECSTFVCCSCRRFGGLRRGPHSTSRSVAWTVTSTTFQTIDLTTPEILVSVFPRLDKRETCRATPDVGQNCLCSILM